VLRLIIELLVGVNALAGIAGLTLRRRRKRELSHEEYLAQLRAQNEELDRELERLKPKE
jgi:LPXTG-motif cell wall-anchored protein